jgi:hypothetical protein
VVPDTVSSVLATVRRAREGLAMARPFAAPGTVFNARISDRRNIAYAELDLDDIKAMKNHFGVKEMNCRIRRWWRSSRFPCTADPTGPAAIRYRRVAAAGLVAIRRSRGFRHRDADLRTQHHRDVAAGQTSHRACRLPGSAAGLVGDGRRVRGGMEELLAHAR